MKSELMSMIIDVYHGSFERIADVMSTSFGRISCVAVFTLSWLTAWFGDTRMTCLCFVIVAVIIDLVWGIISSAKQHKFALSIGFTKTAIKLMIYASIVALAALIEKSVATDVTVLSRAAASVLIVAETISVFGHILIVKPNAPVIKFLWKLLRSEIAKKLGVTVPEVEELFNSINNIK